MFIGHTALHGRATISLRAPECELVYVEGEYCGQTKRPLLQCFWSSLLPSLTPKHHCGKMETMSISGSRVINKEEAVNSPEFPRVTQKLGFWNLLKPWGSWDVTTLPCGYVYELHAFFTFKQNNKTNKKSLHGVKTLYIYLNVILILRNIHEYSFFHSCDSICRLFSPVFPPPYCIGNFPMLILKSDKTICFLTLWRSQVLFDNLLKKLWCLSPTQNAHTNRFGHHLERHSDSESHPCPKLRSFVLH